VFLKLQVVKQQKRIDENVDEMRENRTHFVVMT
jgi:hypothetical protein